MKLYFRYRSSANPNVCVSGVGRWDGPTNTTIGTDCYALQDNIHNGISWVVLHEVNIPLCIKKI